MRNFARTRGEGTPLVGTLRPMLPVSVPEPVVLKPVPGLTWAVTAVPVFDGISTLTLQLYDPHTTGRASHARGKASPLAADYTTQLALDATRFRPQRRGLFGFINSSKYFPSTGLFPVELPGVEKTPIVLVHGLISDPADFTYLANAIAAQDDLRRRYQVWFFYYPTSLPAPYAAMLLREDLQKFIHELDPEGDHAALRRVVLVGHSLGGLLCQLAVTNGGPAFYHHFFRGSLDEMRLTARQRALLERVFFYRTGANVSQVIFVATPHHGSHLALGFLGAVGRLLAHLPLAVITPIMNVASVNQNALPGGVPLAPVFSLSALTPDNPLVNALNDLPTRPGVELHSIIGDRGLGGPLGQSSDGVVPYASSHLPEPSSEAVVHAGHTGTLKQPATAREVIRILRAADVSENNTENL